MSNMCLQMPTKTMSNENFSISPDILKHFFKNCSKIFKSLRMLKRQLQEMERKKYSSITNIDDIKKFYSSKRRS